jgi:hypothetical protein
MLKPFWEDWSCDPSHCGTHPATSLAMSSTSCQACHFTDLKSEGTINHSFLDILQAIGT